MTNPSQDWKRLPKSQKKVYLDRWVDFMRQIEEMPQDTLDQKIDRAVKFLKGATHANKRLEE